MTAHPDRYTAFTPSGPVEIDFPEDGGCIMEGDDDAVAYLCDFIEKNTNGRGMLMSVDTLEPVDLVNFCQPKSSGITILEPLNELIMFGSVTDPDNTA